MPHVPYASHSLRPVVGCDGVWVQVPGGLGPDDRVHAGAPLCTCLICVLLCLICL